LPGRAHFYHSERSTHDIEDHASDRASRVVVAHDHRRVFGRRGLGVLRTGNAFSDTWQLLINSTSSIVTLLMCFVLNNTQKRDTTAINAKLDALVVAVEMADNRIIGVEHRPEEVAAALHEDIVAEVFGSDSAPIDPAIAPKA